MKSKTVKFAYAVAAFLVFNIVVMAIEWLNLTFLDLFLGGPPIPERNAIGAFIGYWTIFVAPITFLLVLPIVPFAYYILARNDKENKKLRGILFLIGVVNELVFWKLFSVMIYIT